MRRFLSVTLAAAWLLAGCGGGTGTPAGTGAEMSLALDGPPHGVHAGIYLASSRGFDRAAGVELEIEPSRGSSESLRRLEAGDAALAIVDINELARALERGGRLVAVMALVQRPLPGAAAPGAPDYPQLVLACTRLTRQEREGDVRAAVEAIQRGYGETVVDPESAVTAMVTLDMSLQRRVIARQLDAAAPAFMAGTRHFGRLHPERLRAWARWALAGKIVSRPVDLRRGFDLSLASATGR